MVAWVEVAVEAVATEDQGWVVVAWAAVVMGLVALEEVRVEAEVPAAYHLESWEDARVVVVTAQEEAMAVVAAGAVVAAMEGEMSAAAVLVAVAREAAGLVWAVVALVAAVPAVVGKVAAGVVAVVWAEEVMAAVASVAARAVGVVAGEGDSAQLEDGKEGVARELVRVEGQCQVVKAWAAVEKEAGGVEAVARVVVDREAAA